jgi:hypothetical protein
MAIITRDRNSSVGMGLFTVPGNMVAPPPEPFPTNHPNLASRK